MCRELVSAPLARLAGRIDLWLEDSQPWRIVVGTASISLGMAYLYSLTRQRTPVLVRIKRSVFKLIRKIPSVRKKVEAEMTSMRKTMVEDFNKTCASLEDITCLPEQGLTQDEVLNKVRTYLEIGDLDWKNGKMSGTVYNNSQQHTDLMTQVYNMAAWTNPLHPDAFPGVRQMEAEIVRMACDMFQGGPESCGCVTTGGTESILLACKAYRDRAIAKGVEFPEILCPVSAHAAFDKAAEILCMNITHVPLDQTTMRVDVAKMKRMITKNTAMLVASAPQFPHGCIDPIPDIGQLGIKYDLPVHVDSCLGGFLVPFMKAAGFKIGGFDFSVEGVTSISADTHKYAFAPKGTSVVLYRSSELRSYQWFSFPDWPGGIYATPTVGGSRSGGLVATCWAAMISFGVDGYVATTREIIQTTKYIAKELENIPGLKLVGLPEVSVVAFGTDQFNIYGLSEEMKNRGWGLNALQFPACIHICVTRLHTESGVADKFIADVKEITAAFMKDPSTSGEGSAAIYGMAASVPDRSIVAELTEIYLDALYTNKQDVDRIEHRAC